MNPFRNENQNTQVRTTCARKVAFSVTSPQQGMAAASYRKSGFSDSRGLSPARGNGGLCGLVKDRGQTYDLYGKLPVKRLRVKRTSSGGRLSEIIEKTGLMLFPLTVRR